MKKLFLIFLIAINGNLISQNTLSQTREYLSSLKEVQEISKLKSKKFKDFEIITTFTELDRKIDFGYKHHRILVMPYSGSDLKINFISYNNKIVVGWISENSVSKGILNTEYFKSNDSFIEDYITKHNKFYNTNFRKEDFDKEILNEYTVGFGCGMAGTEIPDISEKTLKLIERGSIKKLNSFLRSISPEVQTLGAIGILRIGKINKEQRKIIDHLKMRNSKVYSCSGCIYDGERNFIDLLR
ncbi:hypothetical protein ML462_15695 [Gramella lutea]|uniref:Uncharacterized protein n=1 Tax=Christiangramia lutea TaxID=1607951 RepID=A0A9X1V563_9FLAO|nr:hypothetical protein [Christiangramia lutea]MCH4824617.1 hypothetical protein [Christiangramia lutea]